MSSINSVLQFSAVALVCATGAQAQQQGQGGRPPMPSFEKMATELGVSENTVKSCFPAPTQGSGRPERPDMESVATCLQEANPSLTQAKTQEVLQKNAPQQPPRN